MKPEDRKRIKQKRLSYSTVKERQAKRSGARQKRKERQMEEARQLFYEMTQDLTDKNARRRVVERAYTGAFWTIMFNQASAPFFVYLVKKYYSEDLADDDASACLVTCKSLAARGIEFMVASLRKWRMVAPVLKQEFSEWFDTSYTADELAHSLLVLAVEPEMLAHAAHAGEHLFDESGLIWN